VTVFVYSAGKLAAEYSTAPPEQNPTTKWTVTDQLGSPRVLVNSLGEVVSRRDFMPFGEEITPDGTHRTADLKYNFGDNIRQKFTGYQKDEETQLAFAEARMYQNLHGRFTAVDPLLASGKSADPQTFNRYVYVMNNPLIYTDPTGLQAATTISEGRWYSPNSAEDGFIRPTFVEKGLTVPSGWTIMPGVYWNAQSNRYTYLPENESIVGRLNSPIGDSTTSASMPDCGGSGRRTRKLGLKVYSAGELEGRVCTV